MITITTPITDADISLLRIVLSSYEYETNECETAFRNKGRQRDCTKYPGYITRDAIYHRLGCGNYLAFRAACKKLGVRDIINDGHRCYVPLKDAEAIEDEMRKVMGR